MGKFGNIREQVMANRGITLASTTTRRSPHCFNFLRQVEVLSKASFGSAKQHKDWGSATAIVRAFQIGKAEAAAVSNLQSGVEKEVVVILKKEVSIRGLRSYLGHEIVAKGLFNTGYSSSSGATEQWVSVCTNLDDCKLVKLFIQRLSSDWDQLPPGMKRAPSLKDANLLRHCCGLFLHFNAQLEKRLPSSDIAAAKEKLLNMFFLGGMDPELQLCAEQQVPPGDMKNLLEMQESKDKTEQESRAQELQEKLTRATFNQVQSQIEADIQKIRDKLPTKATRTAETAKDMKYVKNRQQYVVCALDATVWPSSTQYILDCLDFVNNICSLSPRNIGHIQLPWLHQATSMNALLKHRRKLEDALLKSDMDFTNTYAEFSQAVVEKTLERGCNLMYYGLFREDAQHKKVLADLEFKVFRHWDSLDTSPPKTRPRPQSTLMVDNLHLLSCTAAGPIWPDALLTKFKAETTEHKELLALKDSFEREFPPPRDTSTTTSASALPPRVSGLPDFTIEHGAKPIDVSRVVGASMSAPPGASDRLALVAGKAGKPSILLDKEYNVWLGNDTDAAATWSGVELFGFNTGTYEVKIVRGDNKRDVAGIAWKVMSDVELVVFEKKPMAVCAFMHVCATTHGLADVGVLEHNVSPKLHPKVA
ncbi:unnamed protein product [Durusdinium trenchii]|uniref:Uncharacterized protein n=1 Tax=Durusdinium trenchii TaxID=1381693 RepID=A0ABP0M3D2_9DINO